MRHNDYFKAALLASCTSTIVLISLINANAQNVTISGSNATVDNPCRASNSKTPIVEVPEMCASLDTTPGLAFNGVEFNDDTGFRSGVLVGTNGTNNNTGPSVSGLMEIIDGGVANTSHLILGNEQNTTGSVIVTGQGSVYNNSGSTTVGNAGEGSLTILNGGSYNHINDDYIYAGYYETGNGSIVVDGVDTATVTRSTLRTNSQGLFGYDGSAVVTITDGGLISTRSAEFAVNANSNATLNISGVNSLNNDRSTFEVRNADISLGAGGVGYANISDGGLLSANRVRIAVEESSSANIIIEGVNAASGIRSGVVSDLANVGWLGTGHALVTNGGLWNSVNWFYLGNDDGGNGYLEVDGLSTNTEFQSTVKTNVMHVGRHGNGEATVTNGGLLELTGQILVGREASGYGKLSVIGVDAVTGTRSEVRTESASLGSNGIGEIYVTSGGLISASDWISVGLGENSTGTLSVDGYDTDHNLASSVVAPTRITIGGRGNATLNLSNRGTLTAGYVRVGAGPDSVGIVNVGIGGAAGIIDTPYITGGQGTATLNFNHLEEIDFSPQMLGTLSVNHVNAGITTLMGESDYTGNTNVSAGTLRAGIENAFSANSHFAISDGSILDLNGYNQTVASLDHAGAIKLNNGTSDTTLTITGDYVGSNGLFELDTYLHDDSSGTDMISIAGDTSGTSNLRVHNTSGDGALTTEGIKIVHVDGSSAGTFNLQGDYVHEGEQAVVGGAYAYKLYQGGTSTPTDGHWYLRSALKPLTPVDPTDPVDPEVPVVPTPPTDPLYQAGVPTYESYAQSLLGLNGVSSLQQRVGNRFWVGNGNRVIAQGADIIEMPYAPPQEAGALVDGNGVWGRIEGAHNKVEPRTSTSDTDYNQNVFKFQAGVDGMLHENENGTLIGGVFVQYVHGKTKTKSVHGDGEISTDGYGFGGTLTWYGNEGFYIDAQAQATWYDSDLSSRIANLGFTSGNDGFGYALSLESGKRFAIDPQWSVTPQAQLVYSHVDFDSFTDVFGAAVSLDRGESLQGRLGITLDHENSWQNAMGMTDRAHVYGIANLYYEFLSGTRVDVAGTSFASEKDRLWGGLGIGGSYNWNDDKYSIYGEGIVNTSLNNFGDSYTLQGNIGFRVKW